MWWLGAEYVNRRRQDPQEKGNPAQVNTLQAKQSLLHDESQSSMERQKGDLANIEPCLLNSECI